MKKRPITQAAVAAPERRWSIYQIRAKALYLGSVIASDRASAIRKVIEEFGVAPAMHNRLMAQLKG